MFIPLLVLLTFCFLIQGITYYLIMYIQLCLSFGLRSLIQLLTLEISSQLILFSHAISAHCPLSTTTDQHSQCHQFVSIWLCTLYVFLYKKSVYSIYRPKILSLMSVLIKFRDLFNYLIVPAVSLLLVDIFTLNLVIIYLRWLAVTVKCPVNHQR